MDQAWFVKIDGTESGPFYPADLQRMAAGGRLQPDALVRAGDGDWARADKLKGVTFGSAKLDVSGSGTRPCPACAEPILIAARKCKHCGEAVFPVGEAKPWKMGKGLAGVILLIGPVVSLVGGAIIGTEGGLYDGLYDNIPNLLGLFLIVVGIAMFFFGSKVFSRREVTVHHR